MVAVLDTGVAYANRGRFRRSPDFRAQRLRRAATTSSTTTAYPNDHNGHGTHVAGTIARGAPTTASASPASPTARSIMPVRVLDSRRRGRRVDDRRAASASPSRHGARRHQPQPRVRRRHVTAVARSPTDRRAALRATARACSSSAAAGNEPRTSGRLPGARAQRDRGRRDDRARLPGRLLQRRLAGSTSSRPAAAPDADRSTATRLPAAASTDRAATSTSTTLRGTRAPRASACRPATRARRWRRRTSPATAALIIACGVLGANPTPARDRAPPEGHGRDLGAPGPDALYGAGLLDAAAPPTAPLERCSAGRGSRSSG